MRNKQKAAPNAHEKRHMDYVASLGCVVCGRPGAIHHIMHMAGKARRRDHRYIVCLCHDHHQGDAGVHGLGSEAAFKRLYGIDLPVMATKLWVGE